MRCQLMLFGGQRRRRRQVPLPLLTGSILRQARLVVVSILETVGMKLPLWLCLRCRTAAVARVAAELLVCSTRAQVLTERLFCCTFLYWLQSADSVRLKSVADSPNFKLFCEVPCAVLIVQRPGFESRLMACVWVQAVGHCTSITVSVCV